LGIIASMQNNSGRKGHNLRKQNHTRHTPKDTRQYPVFNSPG
jgi:hypothetical protein